MDVTGEGNPVEITFRLQRYMCHDCTARRAAETNETTQKKIATTFTSECLPDCIKKHGKISTDIVDAAVNKVVRKRMSTQAHPDRVPVGIQSYGHLDDSNPLLQKVKDG